MPYKNPSDRAKASGRYYWRRKYRESNLEYNPEWKMEGMRQTIKYALLLIHQINNTQPSLALKEELPFPLEK